MTKKTLSKTCDISSDLTVRGSGALIIEDYACIQQNVIIDTGFDGRVVIGRRAKLKSGVIVRCYSGHLSVGARSSIGEYSILACHGGIDIGPLCMFGPYVLVNAAEHITEGVEPYRYLGELAREIVIESGVWIGARATILDGVRIGRRAIIGAHSLVNMDIPAEVLAVGTPVRLVRQLALEKE